MPPTHRGRAWDLALRSPRTPQKGEAHLRGSERQILRGSREGAPRAQG